MLPSSSRKESRHDRERHRSSSSTDSHQHQPSRNSQEAEKKAPVGPPSSKAKSAAGDKGLADDYYNSPPAENPPPPSWNYQNGSGHPPGPFHLQHSQTFPLPGPHGGTPAVSSYHNGTANQYYNQQHYGQLPGSSTPSGPPGPYGYAPGPGGLYSAPTYPQQPGFHHQSGQQVPPYGVPNPNLNTAGFVNAPYQHVGDPPPAPYVPTPPLAQAPRPLIRLPKVRKVIGGLFNKIKNLERDVGEDYQLYHYRECPDCTSGAHHPGHHSRPPTPSHRVEKKYRRNGGRRSASSSTVSESGSETSRRRGSRDWKRDEEDRASYKKQGLIAATSAAAASAYQANKRFWTDKEEFPPYAYSSSPENDFYKKNALLQDKIDTGEGPSRPRPRLDQAPERRDTREDADSKSKTNSSKERERLFYNPNYTPKGEFQPYYYNPSNPFPSNTSSSSSLQTHEGKQNFFKNFFADPPPRPLGYFDNTNKGSSQQDKDQKYSFSSSDEDSSSSEEGGISFALFGFGRGKNDGSKKRPASPDSIDTESTHSHRRPRRTFSGDSSISVLSNPAQYADYSEATLSLASKPSDGSLRGPSHGRRINGKNGGLNRKGSTSSLDERVGKRAVKRKPSGNKKSWFTRALEQLNPEPYDYSTDSDDSLVGRVDSTTSPSESSQGEKSLFKAKVRSNNMPVTRPPPRPKHTQPMRRGPVRGVPIRYRHPSDGFSHSRRTSVAGSIASTASEADWRKSSSPEADVTATNGGVTGAIAKFFSHEDRPTQESDSVKPGKYYKESVDTSVIASAQPPPVPIGGGVSLQDQKQIPPKKAEHAYSAPVVPKAKDTKPPVRQSDFGYGRSQSWELGNPPPVYYSQTVPRQHEPISQEALKAFNLSGVSAAGKEADMQSKTIESEDNNAGKEGKGKAVVEVREKSEKAEKSQEPPKEDFAVVTAVPSPSFEQVPSPGAMDAAPIPYDPEVLRKIMMEQFMEAEKQKAANQGDKGSVPSAEPVRSADSVPESAISSQFASTNASPRIGTYSRRSSRDSERIARSREKYMKDDIQRNREHSREREEEAKRFKEELKRSLREEKKLDDAKKDGSTSEQVITAKDPEWKSDWETLAPRVVYGASLKAPKLVQISPTPAEGDRKVVRVGVEFNDKKKKFIHVEIEGDSPLLAANSNGPSIDKTLPPLENGSPAQQTNGNTNAQKPFLVSGGDQATEGPAKSATIEGPSSADSRTATKSGVAPVVEGNVDVRKVVAEEKKSEVKVKEEEEKEKKAEEEEKPVVLDAEPDFDFDAPVDMSGFDFSSISMPLPPGK